MKTRKPRSRAVRIAAALISAPIAVLPMVLAPPASAAWIVYDPTNYAQNVLQAARALEQIVNDHGNGTPFSRPKGTPLTGTI